MDMWVDLHIVPRLPATVGDVDVSLLASRASARAASVALSLDSPPPSDCLVRLPPRLQRGAPFLEHAASGAMEASCSGSPRSAPASPGDPTALGMAVLCLLPTHLSCALGCGREG